MGKRVFSENYLKFCKMAYELYQQGVGKNEIKKRIFEAGFVPKKGDLKLSTVMSMVSIGRTSSGIRMKIKHSRTSKKTVTAQWENDALELMASKMSDDTKRRLLRTLID